MFILELINEYFFLQNQFGNDSRKARQHLLVILAIPAIFALACMIPASATSFSPEGGTFSDPVEITINSTIEAWTETQPDTDTLQAYRWRFNPAAFEIVSGDEHSRNVTFRAIKETKKPETISYGRKDCSDTSHNDSPCSASETASQKYWRIIRISPPVAGLSVTHNGAGRTAGVRFTDQSTGSPSSWLWDFGDGWGSAEQNPEHTYEKSGKYTVTLRTANKGGDDTATTTVVVEVTEPSIHAISSGSDSVSRSGSVLASIYPSGTVSVLHFNTTGAVIDDTGRSWVPNSLSYSNTRYKFGGGSALFNGASWIYSNNDTAFSPGSENFTIAGWVYFSTTPAGWAPVWGNWWTNQGGSSLDYYGGGPRIVYDNAGTTKIISGTRALPLNAWAYIVLQGKNAGGSSDVTLYVNGVPNGTITGAYTIRKAPSQTRFYFGRATTAHLLLQSGTYVDDFFVVKGGPAMYTGPFTPPVHEFGSPKGPMANFIGTNLSGNSPRLVRFTDTSIGNPDTWNWSFGDGEYSNEQDPLHEYFIGQTYTVSLTASNTNGISTEIKPDFVSVSCPYACDVTLTHPPYIDFNIDRMRCPEDHTGDWWDATCLNNAVIRWSRAGQSSSFYSQLSPWMWKRSACCPDPGYSWAFDSPANKPVYIAGLHNSQVIIDGNIFSHAIAAELLTAENPKNSTWESWKFFNYDNLSLSIGNWQIPVGNESEWTHVWIKSVDTFSVCGQQDGKLYREFFIAPNGTPFDHDRGWYTTGVLKSQYSETQLREKKIPNEVNLIFESMDNDRSFTINKWAFDTTKKELVVYVHDIKDEQVIDEYEKRLNGIYSIHVIHDTEFETTRSEVRNYLWGLRENPDYQINSISMVTDRISDSPGNIAEVWVYKTTPENQKLDNTVIQGWKIRVYAVGK